MAIFKSKAIWKSGLTQGTFYPKLWMFETLLVTHQFANKFYRKCNCFRANAFPIRLAYCSCLFVQLVLLFFCCLCIIHLSHYIYIGHEWTVNTYISFIWSIEDTDILTHFTCIVHQKKNRWIFVHCKQRNRPQMKRLKIQLGTVFSPSTDFLYRKCNFPCSTACSMWG